MKRYVFEANMCLSSIGFVVLLDKPRDYGTCARDLIIRDNVQGMSESDSSLLTRGCRALAYGVLDRHYCRITLDDQMELNVQDGSPWL